MREAYFFYHSGIYHYDPYILRPSTEYVLILTTDCLLMGTWYVRPLGFKTPVSFGQIMLINLSTQLRFRMAPFGFRQMNQKRRLNLESKVFIPF